VQRLIPAIIEAWREAERAFDAAAEPQRSELAERIHVLQQAHAMGAREGCDREMVVRFLDDHGLGAIVLGDGDGLGWRERSPTAVTPHDSPGRPLDSLQLPSGR
jgi:hypothetical protein